MRLFPPFFRGRRHFLLILQRQDKERRRQRSTNVSLMRDERQTDCERIVLVVELSARWNFMLSGFSFCRLEASFDNDLSVRRFDCFRSLRVIE